MIKAVAALRGKTVSAEDVIDQALYKEKQYDRLADILRQSLDMDRIYGIVNESGRTV